MLHVPTGAGAFGASVPSWGATRPSATNGAAVTPGVGTKGSWVQLFAAQNADTYGVMININSNNGSAASRGTALDFGWDEAGGTSYQVRIPDILCGGAGSYGTPGGGLWYYFPIFIPAGSTIAVRANSTASPAFRVGAVIMQKPVNPSMVRRGSFVEVLGLGAGENIGTVIVPGTTAEGAWTLVGTTSKRCWWWQLGVQVSLADTTWGAGVMHFDVGVGDGTAGGTDVIITDASYVLTASEALTNTLTSSGVEWDVPSGSNIYVRAQHSATPDSGYTCTVYGLGG